MNPGPTKTSPTGSCVEYFDSLGMQAPEPATQVFDCKQGERRLV